MNKIVPWDKRSKKCCKRPGLTSEQKNCSCSVMTGKKRRANMRLVILPTE